MKYLLLILFVTGSAKADIIIGPSVKYGVSGSNTTTVQTGSYTSTTTNDRVQTVVGLKVQTVPCWGGTSIGGGIYMDNTIELNLGIRL